MKKSIFLSLLSVCLTLTMHAQTEVKKVYNEDIDPFAQINQAVVKAKSEGKFLGGG